jgi:hypothetical protein
MMARYPLPLDATPDVALSASATMPVEEAGRSVDDVMVFLLLLR